jgi:hypothetical protein
MNEHLKTASVFKGTSKTIQNEILDSMFAVCQTEIRNQINEADFLSVQCDEITDVASHCQMVVVFRYIFQCNVVERFWSFVRVTEKTADGISQSIKNVIDPLLHRTPNKLIAQTYDGANVMSGAIGGVQAKIKDTYKHAHFVHCYAHQLNLIMQKATSQNPKVKVFFSNLSAIPNFFSHLTYRCDVLEDVVKRRLPKVATTRWNYNIRTVNTVFENREALIECFAELEEKCDKSNLQRSVWVTKGS